MSDLGIVSKIISPEQVRQLLRANPSYNRSRDRAAAAVHVGLDAYDTYQKARPFLFWGSLAGLAGSSWMLYKRRRVGAEAWWTWGSAAAICGAVAWVTRPAMGGAASPDGSTPSPEGGSPGGGVTGWLDRKVTQYRESEGPEFADGVVKRLLEIPGLRKDFDDVDPLVQAAIL